MRITLITVISILVTMAFFGGLFSFAEIVYAIWRRWRDTEAKISELNDLLTKPEPFDITPYASITGLQTTVTDKRIAESKGEQDGTDVTN